MSLLSQTVEVEMLTRYRWYRIQLPRVDFDLTNIIAGKSLTQNASYGFSRIEGAMGDSMFRFLWREKVVVTLFDEEGTPSYEEVANVNFTDFAIIHIDDATFLRIENPGRNIRDLLNTLESLIGLGFTSQQVSFEKINPLVVFESVDVINMIGLKVVGAVIDEDLVARIDLASKQGMKIDKIQLLEGLHYKVVSAVFELIHEGVRGQVTYASSGLVKVSGKLAPKLLYLIEKDLPKLM